MGGAVTGPHGVTSLASACAFLPCESEQQRVGLGQDERSICCWSVNWMQGTRPGSGHSLLLESQELCHSMG